MPRYLVSFAFLFFSLFLFGEENYLKNNTAGSRKIEVSIFNNSKFDIEVIEKDFLSEPLFKIKPFETKKFIRTVSNEPTNIFYRYLIPIGADSILLDNFEWRFPIIFDKNQLLKIPEIKENTDRDVYCIIKNTSNASIYLCHSSITYKSIKNKEIITAGGCEVFSSKNCHLFLSGVLLFIGNQVSLFPLPDKDLQPGYVYTYTFDGKQVIKEDERPLIAVHEPLWSTPYTSTEIASVVSGDDTDCCYVIGKENKNDSHGMRYEAAAISCMDSAGREKWRHVFTETGSDTSFYAGLVLHDGSILAAGSYTKDSHTGLIVQYAKDGTVLQSQKVERFAVFDSIIKKDGQNFLLTGFAENGSFLTANLTAESNRLQCISHTYPIPLNRNEAVTKAIPFYDDQSKMLFLFCNLVDWETEQVLPAMVCTVSEDGTAERITLQNMIQAVSSVVRDSSGLFYIGGETVTQEHSAAAVVCFDYTQKNTEVFYTDGAPYSYITAVQLNKKSRELIISGTLHAADSFGNGGTPFMKSFDTGSGKELWKRTAPNKNYELLSSFVPCADYGFIAAYTNVTEDGAYTAPSGILRLNATGKSGIDTE